MSEQRSSNEIADYWRSDASKEWTCIPGRVCGGAQFMREARAEIERLTAELADLGNPKAGVGYWVDECNKARAERDRLRAALDGLLREMSLEHSLPSYEVYQVTHGAVSDARNVLAGATDETTAQHTVTEGE